MTKEEHVRKVLEAPGTYCSCMMLLLIDRFGTDALGWEPDTIEMELAAIGVNMSQLLSDKVNAGMSLMATDLYFKSIDGFNAVNTAFNLKPVNARAFHPLSLAETMWGVTEAKFLLGPEDYAANEYGHDIAIYTGLLLSTEGITAPPAMLAYAEFGPDEMNARDQALMNDKPFAEAYWQRQDEARAELNAATSARLLELMKQIQGLPLNNAVPDLPKRINDIIQDIGNEAGNKDQIQDNAPPA